MALQPCGAGFAVPQALQRLQVDTGYRRENGGFGQGAVRMDSHCTGTSYSVCGVGSGVSV